MISEFEGDESDEARGKKYEPVAWLAISVDNRDRRYLAAECIVVVRYFL